MGDVKLVKSIYTGSDVTSLGELAAADNARIPGTLQVDGASTLGSLAGFLFGTAGAVSALTGAQRIYVGSFAKNTADVDATLDVTAPGFLPTAVLFLVVTPNTAEVSIGLDDGTAHICIANQHGYAANQWTPAGYSIYLVQAAGIGYTGIISAMLSSGFRISWVKTGAKAGTASVYYLALR